ncbi:MAG: hypothetical protein NTZ52_03290 [Chlamydiae bacterium]|nr:hypothetical protein [Chlamydiota bacterium]
MHAPSVSNNSTMFQTALPYGAATLAVGVCGACIAAKATTTAVIITGVALALLGSATFIGIINCSLTSKNVAEFKEKIFQHITPGVAGGVAGGVASVILGGAAVVAGPEACTIVGLITILWILVYG